MTAFGVTRRHCVDVPEGADDRRVNVHNRERGARLERNLNSMHGAMKCHRFLSARDDMLSKSRILGAIVRLSEGKKRWRRVWTRISWKSLTNTIRA